MPRLQLDFWAVTLPYKDGEEVFAGDPHVRDIHGHELYNFEHGYFGSYFGCGKCLFLDPFQANAFLENVIAALEAGVDEILSDADVGNLPTYLRNYGWSWRTRKRSLNLWGGTLNPSSGTPPSGTPPGSATPPTASVWVPWGSGPHPIRPRGVALPIPISA